MDMKQLAAWVDEQGGVGRVELRQLRDAVDADKLGKLVMQRIARELSAHGLGYFPREVLDDNDQPRQHQSVRLYRKGTGQTARAIEAVLEPSDVGDAFLNDLNTDNAREMLSRIRELVGTTD